VVSMPHNPGIFGSSLPSAITFLVGILLFFLPFAEIKCGGTSMAVQTGKGFAMGEDYKPSAQMNRLGKIGGKEDGVKDNSTTGPTEKLEKGNTQIFALAAAG